MVELSVQAVLGLIGAIILVGLARQVGRFRRDLTGPEYVI